MAKQINWNEVVSQMATGKKVYTDDNAVKNLFQPKVKEDGSYDAVIRFIPSIDTDLPYVTMHSHSYQSETGKWMIENCPQTIGKKCPICDNANKLWNNGEQDAARDRFKKTSYYANILVVKDPQNPDNEGKVFVYRFGKKMFELIKSKMIPASSLDEPVMVFDMIEGANFKLKIRSRSIKLRNGTTKSVPNYDSSEFMSPSAIGSEEYIEKVEAMTNPLSDIVTASKFKTGQELTKKLNDVEGFASKDSDAGESVEFEKALADSKAEKKEPKKDTKKSEDEDDEFFARLRQGKT